jgi:hypothetical protein
MNKYQKALESTIDVKRDVSDTEREKLLFPNLENETTELLKLMLLEIRGRDWSTLGKSTILKHDYIQSILIKRERR